MTNLIIVGFELGIYAKRVKGFWVIILVDNY
jgi:hypothetical protein